jgi:superfamily II DNA or RNA helicase
VEFGSRRQEARGETVEHRAKGPTCEAPIARTRPLTSPAERVSIAAASFDEEENVKITINARIELPTLGLPTTCVEDLKREFTYVNPLYQKHRAMGFRSKESEKIVTWRLEYNPLESSLRKITFPRGGLPRVMQVLREHLVLFTIEDKKFEGRKIRREEIPNHLLKLRAFQPNVVARILANDTALILAPGGVGKTVVSFAVIAARKVPTLILVREGPLFDQWVRRASIELGISEDAVGKIGAGHKTSLRPVTVGSVKYLAKREVPREVREYFGQIIADEIVGAAADQYFSVLDAMPARFRLGVSGDIDRKDDKRFLIHDLFGDVTDEITEAQAVATGAVLDVEVRIVPTKFEAPWYQGGRDHNLYLERSSKDEDRDVTILEIVKDELNEGGTGFVFSHRVEHCERLRDAISCEGARVGMYVGDAAHEESSEAALLGIREKRIDVIVGTIQSIGIGVDVPHATFGVAATAVTLNKSQFRQARWRLSRITEGKRSARFYVLWDQHVLGIEAIKNAIRWSRKVTVLESDGVTWTDASEYLRQRGAVSFRSSSKKQEAEDIMRRRVDGTGVQQATTAQAPVASAQTAVQPQPVPTPTQRVQAPPVSTQGVAAPAATGRPVMTNNPHPIGVATEHTSAEGEEVTATWGEELFTPRQFNSFRVGPFTYTTKVRRGESVEQAYSRALTFVTHVAEQERARKHKSYVAALKELSQSANGAS